MMCQNTASQSVTNQNTANQSMANQNMTNQNTANQSMANQNMTNQANTSQANINQATTNQNTANQTVNNAQNAAYSTAYDQRGTARSENTEINLTVHNAFTVYGSGDAKETADQLNKNINTTLIRNLRGVFS
jgi:hypothetical protein